MVIGGGDLWPVHDAPLVMMKHALEAHSRVDPKTGMIMIGLPVKGFPWKWRALCYTGGFIWGWKNYMNASGDMMTDWENHLDFGRKLREKLNETWNATAHGSALLPLSHMDEYILGWNLLENKVEPVIEPYYGPQQIGKHFAKTED